MIFYTLKAR